MPKRHGAGGHLMVPHTQTMTKLDSDKDGVRVPGVWADSAKSSAGRWAPSRTVSVTPRAGPAGGWQEVPGSIWGHKAAAHCSQNSHSASKCVCPPLTHTH